MIINYDGKWPNLCSGRLNVMLGGKLYKFGSNVIRSGGSCRCEFNTNENYVTKGEWHWSVKYVIMAIAYHLSHVNIERVAWDKVMEDLQALYKLRDTIQ